MESCLVPRAPVFATGVKPILRLRTKEGHQVRLTGNHRVLKLAAQTRYRHYTEWVAAEQLCPGDRIMLHDHRGLQPWDGPGDAEEGWLLGTLVGDGCFMRDNNGTLCAKLSFWEASAPKCSVAPWPWRQAAPTSAASSQAPSTPRAWQVFNLRV